MTKAIRLHKDDELLFVKEQKRILSFLNSSCEKNIAFPFFPLIAELDSNYFENKSCMELKNSFKSVVIAPAVLIEEKIFCPVNIVMKDGFEFKSKLLIGLCKSKEKNTKAEELKSSLFKKIRVFQLAEIKKTLFQTEFWNNVWIKI